MSRKDYNRLADALRLAIHQTRGTLGSYGTLKVAAELIAGELAEDNPRFDRSRFLTACGFVEIAADPPEPQSVAADAEWEAVLSDAHNEGREHGVSAGGWLIDGRTTEETARRMLQGIEEGDPEILDMLPASPLSGEWAGGLTPRDVLGMYDLDDTDDGADDVLAAFEDGYAQGVTDEVCRSAREMLGDEDPAS